MITLREVPDILAMSVRGFSKMETIGPDMGKMYHEVWDCGGEEAYVWDGEQCFALYYCPFDPNNIDMECGFAVKELLPDKGNVKGRSVAGGLMAMASHTGSYKGLPAVYEAIGKWIEDNGYELAGQVREVYLNDPAVTPEEELKTEVWFPVGKKLC